MIKKEIKATIFVWDGMGDDVTKYFYFYTDMTEFDKVYINSGNNSELEEELDKFLHTDGGECDIEMYKDFPIDVFYTVPVDNIAVINCGLIP